MSATSSARPCSRLSAEALRVENGKPLPKQRKRTEIHCLKRRFASSTGGVERDAPHRARLPPHQTVRADFPHMASRVKLSLPIPLACQRNQSHMLKFAIVCLCIFQLIPSLAPAVQPDVHSELYVLIDLAEHLGGTPATEVSTPSAPYVLCRSQTHDIGFIHS